MTKSKEPFDWRKATMTADQLQLLPIVMCEPDGKDWKFWCPFCVRWHHHSAGSGHRIAHCTVEHSPFRENGYILTNRREEKKLEKWGRSFESAHVAKKLRYLDDDDISRFMDHYQCSFPEAVERIASGEHVPPG